MSATGDVGVLHRLGAWCARHCVIVLVAWLAAAGGLHLLQASFGGTYSDSYSIPGSQSADGQDVLAAHAPALAGVGAQVVLHDARQPLTADADQIGQAVGSLASLPHVVSAQSPLPADSQPTGALSDDGRTGYISVTFDTNPASLDPDYLDGVDRAVAPLRQRGVEVEYGGPLGELARPAVDDRRSETIGFAVAIVVLLAAFGSLLAAGVPLFSALVAVVSGLSCLKLLASAFTFASVSPTLATMIGLGVGIDYALFVTTRHRRRVMDGAEPAAAAGEAAATSGRAVLVSGTTVVVALAGLYASQVSFIGKLGAAAAVTVVTAVVGALTLVPALLGLAGRRIDRYHVRTPVAEGTSGPGRGDGGFWHAFGSRVARRPWWCLAGGVVILAVLATPLLSIRLGHIDDGADPTSFTDRRAYDLISDAFGPGHNGPFTAVVDTADVPSADRPAVQRSVADALDGVPGTAAVTPVEPVGDGDVLTATVVPLDRPQSAATADLYDALTDQVLPRAVAGTAARTYVTGAAAQQQDFSGLISARLPVIIAVVVGLAFLIILAVFRGVLVAVKAAALNLASVAASFGVVVAVFQWGWGGPALGVNGTVPVESYVPMMMFAIVFGLSMDYEVFLLSRIHAAWLRDGDAHAAVVRGLEVTARVITSAALIMASVFAAFLISDDIVVKMLGLGLAVSVLIDASVVRLLLVPAVLMLLGRGAWWAPAWLRRLPPRGTALRAD